ncbi:MAG: phospholipid carrier-dependent glycosyltransferase, partial [Chloroflexi bacterium]|nr:phospholipid carrier-dependent glycosyltransferase [Chloroflexota bacterium]
MSTMRGGLLSSPSTEYVSYMADHTIPERPMSSPVPENTCSQAEEASEPAHPAEVTWSTVWTWLERSWASLGQVIADPRVQYGLLAVILLMGAALRFTGVAWDENQHLHPDERFLTMVENGLRWPESFSEYLDSSRNPLNPYNSGPVTYVYGLFPVVAAKFLGQLTGKTGYDGVYLAGRVMNGSLDLICVFLVFLMGRRLYDARVGLLGALFAALSVFNIQNAHFFTVDLTTTFFVTLAMYYVIRVAQGGGWGSVVMLGVAFGLAVSAKISVLSFPLVIVLAYLLRLLRGSEEQGGGSGPLVDLRRRLGRLNLAFRVMPEPGCAPPARWERLLPSVIAAAASFGVVLVVAFLVFRVAQPHAFTGPGFFDLKLVPKWQEDMEWIRKQVAGDQDFPPSHQWTSRAPVFYMLENMVLWGFGLPLGLAVWASWALMAYEMYRKHKWAH